MKNPTKIVKTIPVSIPSRNVILFTLFMQFDSLESIEENHHDNEDDSCHKIQDEKQQTKISEGRRKLDAKE